MNILANQKITDHERKHRRIRVLKGAQLQFRNKLVSIDCMMRDLSVGGARIRLNGPTGLPDRFNLRMNGTGDKFPAKLVWRRGNDVGVSFESYTA
jgi:two-component system cell cycle response regulator